VTTAVTVQARINYTGQMSEKPRYHAMDASRDVHVLDPRTVAVSEAHREQARLESEGFQLVPHSSSVRDFLDSAELERVYYPEVIELILEVTGARAAAVAAAPFVRFGERSSQSGRLRNSRPARFVHIDYGDARGKALAEHMFGTLEDRSWQFRRFVHYNIWRVLTPPPQDVPLALCEARSLAREDLIESLAVFDFAGVPERIADSYVLRYNPAHRWRYFRDMTPEEALIFVTNESDPALPHHVPHTAFDDPLCPASVLPRSSIEIRVVAFFE
jgi:hypothetical protein